MSAKATRDLARLVLTRRSVPPSGDFEPPGAGSLAAFVAEYDRSVDPRVIAAELRAANAEQVAFEATIGKSQSWIGIRAWVAGAGN